MNMIRLLAEVDMGSVMNNGMSVQEKLSDGGKMILIVMAFVFSVIFVIWLAQTIISSIVCKAQSNTDNISASAAKEPAVMPQETASAPVPSASQNTSGDDVTVAVITAALTAYLASTSEDGTVLPFRVVSFKRKSSGKPWNS